MASLPAGQPTVPGEATLRLADPDSTVPDVSGFLTPPTALGIASLDRSAQPGSPSRSSADPFGEVDRFRRLTRPSSRRQPTARFQVLVSRFRVALPSLTSTVGEPNEVFTQGLSMRG